MLAPRFYQIQAIDAISQRFRAGVTRPLLALATGLGKTICFALLAKKLDTQTIIIAHRDELIQQAADKVSLIWPGVDIGIVKGARNEVGAQVVVASIQSASRLNRLNQLKTQNFKLCIVDEAHHCVAESYKFLIDGLGFMNNDLEKLLLGVTATPRRANGTGLDEVFQEIAFQMGIKEGIDQGYLSPLIGRQILSKVDLKSVGISDGDFITRELSLAVNTPSRNSLIVDSFQKYAEGRKKVLAFAVDVQHAEDLSEAFRRAGISSRAVSGGLDVIERRHILKEFSDGSIRVLCNCCLLVEGFDQPDIDMLLLCRPTQSEPLYIQMCGRATRLHPSKANALILDFVDNSSKHKLSSFACLEDAIKDILAEREEIKLVEKISSKKDCAAVEYAGDREINFFEERQFAWTKIGQNWHLRIGLESEIWVNKRDDEKFDVIALEQGNTTSLSKQPLPLDYATGLAEDWARRQPKGKFAQKDAYWRSEPATSKQLEALSRFGFQVNRTVTKGEAAILLDTKFSEPATLKQISWLRGHGIEFPKSITKLQAKRLIAERLRI